MRRASPASVGVPERAPVILGTVAASPTIGIIPATIGTPPAIVMAQRAVRRNPSASPPAPMTRHWVPARTAATPHLDDTRRWNNLLDARPQGSSVPRYRGGQSEHPGHRQSENAHFWSPPAHLGFDAQPIRFSGDPQSRAFACVCCRRQISSLVKPPWHRLRPASALALSFTGAALLTSAAEPV